MRILPYLSAIFLASALSAQHANLTVVHGIPNLGAPVDVFANNTRLFSFDFKDVVQLDVPAAQYLIEVKLNGMTVLSANPQLAAGVSYAAVAHLQVGGGIQLSLFQNDVSTLQRGSSRITVRHMADAPAVDVGLDLNGSRAATIPNLTNPNEAIATAPANTYAASVFLAGTSTVVAGPVNLALVERTAYVVYAVGSPSNAAFDLIVQGFDLRPRSLTTTFKGTGCGGAFGVSNPTPSFGVPFTVDLTGATPNAATVFFAGGSDSSIGGLPLPLALDFIGGTGCSLYTSGELAIGATTDGSGSVSLAVTVPATLATTLGTTYHQFAFASNANALGLLFTNYLELGVQIN